MQTYLAIIFALSLMSGTASPNILTSNNVEKDSPGHLSFVREFSSRQDVGLSHRILNRTVDIIAGAREGKPTDALQEPYSVTTDSRHRIFVTDGVAGVVHVFDVAHSRYSLLRGGHHLISPLGIAADHEGNIYVTDRSLETIQVYNSKGKFTHPLKRSRRHESYFDTPQGIAVDVATGHIYVCDTSRHMVIMLDKKGHVLMRMGKRFGGSGPGEFSYPTQVAVNGDDLIVLDSGNYRVQILDVQGHFRKEIPLAFDSSRSGLAADNNRNIYVADPSFNHLKVFSHDGQFLYDFGEGGTGAGQFNAISGLWVDSGHCLYVVDTLNKRVQLFQISGPNTGGC